MSLGPCHCYTKEEFGVIGRRVKRKRNSPKSEVRQKPEKQLTTLRSCELDPMEKLAIVMSTDGL